MHIIDPHVHLLDLEVHRYPWMENSARNFLGDASAIKKSYLLPDLLADAGADLHVEQIVHVEANHDPADPLAEARWIQSLADAPQNRGLPQAIVAGADLSQENVQQVLEAHLALRNLRGVRQILNVHPSPMYDFVGRHYMREPLWRKNFGLLQRFGLGFELQIYPAQMVEAAQLARAHPDTTLILNHAGMFCDRGSPAGWRLWRDGLRALAACPNVSVKISGLAMLDHHWTLESLRPYALEAIDAFDCERAMFASNFPVDKLFCSYRALWQTYAQIVADCSASERDALLRTNAQRIYRL
ncbi:amidohydrolase [Verminephrobacter aporrectodeae subsp. tuberculatae]|uniref:Amidohydrolase n=1 Tax=Verminephrobacter aporrectodeae subsp. tuberculatae TaxID=1110392 RepID=A0ABT3KSQ3_9BURK|nr:amidohydrolase family protein [Verminephrobacter aporrectodeae]MCW5320840.1 amidohydrolase [Verminephrobacter aporrectodeae subsp. tuberculatae]